jgi:hypothetical protein
MHYGSDRVLCQRERRENNRSGNRSRELVQDRAATEVRHILAFHRPGGSRNLSISLILNGFSFLSRDRRWAEDLECYVRRAEFWLQGAVLSFTPESR